MQESILTIDEIRLAQGRLNGKIRRTPIWSGQGHSVAELLGDKAQLQFKLELFQHTGTFKARGALLNLMDLTAVQLEQGVTAFSAGNHAIAVAYAARMMSSSAKVVMPKTANSFRVEQCRALGAEIIFAENVHECFERVCDIEKNEGRVFVHPFDGENVTLGTATLGLEFCEQAGPLDAVIIPIGGGGLCAGVASAVKHNFPECKIYGVEPSGAATMHTSLQSGKPNKIESVDTIADSLGAPHTEPYSFSICQKLLDQVVLVDDEALCQAMYWLFTNLKLAVEPAAAASTAALFGPLKDELQNKRVGLIVCGANIDAGSFTAYIQRGAQAFA